MRASARLAAIEPFHVMAFSREAHRIAGTAECDPARGGERMLALNVGEPDFTAPPLVRQAAERAIRDGRTQYTHSDGLPALREAIAGWHATRFGLAIDPARVLVTAGASAGLQLACLALFDAGDEVLMPDPCYPCNRNFVHAAGAVPRLLPCAAAQRFQPDAAAVAAAWGPRTRGVLLASPSNPTGTSIDPQEMRRIHAVVRERGGVLVVDEIYLGLSYDDRFGHSALALGDDIVVVGSFSKYFSMTGWRLGWLVLPVDLAPQVEKLSQHLYICASSVAQHAALACFEPASLAEFERRREVFRHRRDRLVPALDALGLRVPVMPDGAFYAWIDVSAHRADSWAFAEELLRTAHVALTPGRDFSRGDAHRWLRMSYASDDATLDEALARLERTLTA